jgi:hypothetical protein
MEQKTFWKVSSSKAGRDVQTPCTEPGSSLPCSQQPSAGQYSEQEEHGSYARILLLEGMSTHRYPERSICSRFATKTPLAFSILLDLMLLITFSWYRSWLRHYTTSQKVAGSIADEAIAFFFN